MTAAVVALAIVWLLIAAGVAIAAARRLHVLQTVVDQARSNEVMLRQSPARPLLVRPDDTIEMDPSLARALGFGSTPGHLEELTSEEKGIEAGGLVALRAALDDSRASASRLAVTVRANGSEKAFDIVGDLAPDGRIGTFLLWFYDLSASEVEKAALALRLKQSEAALGA